MALAHRRRTGRAPLPGPSRRGEAGTGLIGSLAAVVVFLAFLLLSTQILLALYARSVVSAAGYDAARRVASRHVDHTDPRAVIRAQEIAGRELRGLLGPVGDHATITWSTTPRSVQLRVRLEVPNVGLRPLTRPLGLMTVDRTFEVRTEDLR